MTLLPTLLIAANPNSGARSRHELVQQLIQLLRSSQRQVEVCQTLDEVQQRSHQLYQQQALEAVVAAGGDGTAAAVVNLIPPAVPLAVFPLGTENLLAKQMGLSADPALAARTITAGKQCLLDVGQANGRIFMVMLGCGFDAEVVVQMAKIRRGHINRWSYVKPIWQAIRNYNYPMIEIQLLDRAMGERCEDRGQLSEPCEDAIQSPVKQTSGPADTAMKMLPAAWLFAFNLPRYAAGLPFCPQAVGNDGRLDLCAFRRGGLGRGLYYLANLWCGRHQRLGDFCHVRSSHFRLSSDRIVPYQVDGDPGGVLPLEVRVLPGRLRLLVP